MRSPQAIQLRIETETEDNVHTLTRAATLTTEQLILEITEMYEAAFLSALRHRPNLNLVDKLATLTWLAGSDLIVTDVPWLQYGMPRIRRMAKELKLPWIPIGDNQLTLFRANRMSNGLPCVEDCLRCFRGR